MIQLCPHCGHVLPQSLSDGITCCVNCSRVFDSCPFNRLLSGGWLARKQNIDEPEVLESYGFKREEAILIIVFVTENGYNPQDYAKALEILGVSKDYVPSEV